MEQRGPYKVLSSNLEYKSSRFEVRKDKVIGPDGKEASRGMLVVKPGASILALDDNDFVYLAEEFHYGFGESVVEAVAGGREGDEDFLAVAKRELEEEAGIIAGEWTELGSSFALTSYMRHEQRLYLARKLSFVSAKPDSTEIITVKKVPFAEAIAMVMDGRIFDAYSCVLILKAAKFLGKL